MKYTEAKQGRVFVIRLHDGDIVHENIEALAETEGVSAGTLVILGGADRESRLVAGPEDGRATPVQPIVETLTDVHEVAGVGTLFPDADTGKSVLHMHMACGRHQTAMTGCIREGVRVWQVMEAVLIELTDVSAVRSMDPVTGFKLLSP